MDPTCKIHAYLKQLRMTGLQQTLAARNRQAIDGKWSYQEFLMRLLQDEIERRTQKRLALRLRRSSLNMTKTLETFDFNFNPTVDRQKVLDLAACDYIRQHRNVLICGPTGTGKSHISNALGHEACRQEFDVLFISTHKMRKFLHGGRADGTLEKRFDIYLRPDLLILDDFGLQPLRPPGPEDLFHIIAERYEHRSIMLTSNRAPTEWPDLFGDPLLASAGLDRLLHHANVLTITGPSFRAQDRQPLEPTLSIAPGGT